MDEVAQAEQATSPRETVERFWQALYRRDWEAIGGYFGPESTYTDMATPPEDVAVGPDQIVRRIRLGLEPITGYDHHLVLMAADGDVVVTEHTETWRWHSGEEVILPFVSVQELHGTTITRWSDYWDLQTLLGSAPQWWIEHIMGGWAE